MAKVNSGFQPRSLSQHFEPPEGFAGCFGWLCGYSGDASFLDIAAECFLGQAQAQRAHGGRIGLAVMLDPGNPQVTVLMAPGVLHLPMKTLQAKPFHLLHAKVALLGFGEADGGARWRLRLLVSTGNWTRETLDQNLDLAWSVELKSEDLGANDDAVRVLRADVHAAWSLLDWLRSQFDARVLLSNAEGETALAATRFESWCKKVSRPQGVTPRFFHSRTASLLSQLPERIPKRDPAAGRHVARNQLWMGSGFFESSTSPDKAPMVLTKIAAFLRENGLLTAHADIVVVVNPTDCQAIATCFDAIVKQQGWSVRASESPKFLGTATRFMHAKFIFSANRRGDSNNCASPWVYLGSGNLTGPGFDSPMSKNGGNLEAGVVVVPDTLQWNSERGVEAKQVLSNLLPISIDGNPIEVAGKLSAGAGMVERETAFLAAPVGWLDWQENEGGNCLTATVKGPQAFDVLDGAGRPCPQVNPGCFEWPGERPRQVQVRWLAPDGDHTCSVPVLDGYGRFGGTALPAIELDAAWWQLDGFPLPPDVEGPVDAGEPGAGTGHGPAQGQTRESRYPVREMMQMIENIAARQTALRESDWAAWCIRLRQTLEQAAGSAAVSHFIALGVNPLSPLREAPFRPLFAEDALTLGGQRYESALRAIESAWGVAALPALGAIA